MQQIYISLHYKDCTPLDRSENKAEEKRAVKRKNIQTLIYRDRM